MNSQGTTRKPGRLEADQIKIQLTSPHHLLAALGLVALSAAPKKSYKIQCPWCGQHACSVWYPGPGKSVIATCKGTCNKTRSPFELIARVMKWEIGSDFATKILPLAAAAVQAALEGTRTMLDVPAPQVAQKAPQVAQKAPQVSQAALKAPMAAQVAQGADEQEDEDPLWVRLHPDRTPEEWTFIGNLGVDPHEVRTGIKVMRGEKAQAARLVPHIREGYTIWMSTVDADGGSSSCAINPASGEWRPFGTENVLANEFAEEVLEDGPRSRAAWPKAEQERPTLYLTRDPLDYLRAKPKLQRRLNPLFGLLDRGIPAKVANRMPPCKRVLLYSGAISRQVQSDAMHLDAQLDRIADLAVPRPQAAAAKGVPVPSDDGIEAALFSLG